MKTSIRAKLFIGLTVVILFFVAFSIFLNNNYLESYYLHQKMDLLDSTAKLIDEQYSGAPEDILLALEGAESTVSVNVLILDSRLQVKYLSLPRRNPALRSDPSLDTIIERYDELVRYGSFNLITRDLRLNADFLNLVYLLNNRDILILSTPLAAIQANAAVANRFFLYTGLATLVLGSLAAFLFARRFTRPILEMNRIAQNMSKLDFSQKVEVKSQDELGELGQSLNSLSEQLSRSIAELQAANALLQEEVERERKIDEMRKEFISSVSHELKTPLSLIQGYAEGLKLNVAEDEASKNFYCEVIMDEAVKMDKLVRELLELSQMEAGGFKLEKEVFNLAELLELVLAKYEPRLAEMGIKPQLEYAPFIEVYADMTRTEQVLVNYLNNALNHIDENKQLRIGVVSTGDKYRLTVFNSGAHIPKEALPKLFTSFYKVDKARTRSYGGTGLGLAVVRAIQELDRNRYGVENQPGGVQFWFELDPA
ncbi:MAG: HAMP domain-containing protein [Syntrophomonadaceae bacterium]|nr:HAMP domain-containing protein [Syntrophomonadaceae bacterium]